MGNGSGALLIERPKQRKVIRAQTKKIRCLQEALKKKQITKRGRNE